MKYALISEEQIKHIKWVLDNILTPQSLEPLNPYAVMQTLSVLRSLKPSEPVAWGFKSKSGAIIDCISHEQHEILAGEYDHPLYTSPPRKESENPDGAFIDEGSKPEQEPVAWIGNADFVKGQFVEGRVRRVWWECNTGVGQPLYTEPPKREWVGLTDEELVELRETHGAHILNLMFAVEAKVREKNNAV